MSTKTGETGVHLARGLTAKWTVGILLFLLAAALIALAFLYPMATRRFVALQDQPLVERAQRAAALESGTTAEEVARKSIPVAMRLTDRTCVELKPLSKDIGNYLACYDDRTGRILEERSGGPTFP